MNAILAHDVSVVAADFYLQTHSTNPFLTTATVDSAITAFLVRARRAACTRSALPCWQHVQRQEQQRALPCLFRVERACACRPRTRRTTRSSP
jgi:CMP-N-acetylneuraminic acid synthetase